MGYLLIDMREAGGRLEEYDTRACCHCGGVVRVYRPPYTHRHTPDCQRYGCDHEQGYCMRCDGVVCLYCLRRYGSECVIYRRLMEEAIRRYEANRQWERLTGISLPR